MMLSTVRSLVLVAAAAMLTAACGPAKRATPPESGSTAEPNDQGAASAETSAVAVPAEGAATAAPAGGTSSPNTKDAPEISRSPGVAGGVVVFWPRIVPRTDDPATKELAGKLQKRLTDLVAKAVPKRERDVRPDPERVCQRSGCAAMTVGVLLVPQNGGCVAVALVSGPDKSPARLIPWGGAVDLKQKEVPFRDPPESSITVNDMVPCAKLADKLGERDADVVKAIQEAAANAK
jgi:hypothetical protein